MIFSKTRSVLSHLGYANPTALFSRKDLRLVAEEAGDDDLSDVGSMGAPAAHTHHSE